MQILATPLTLNAKEAITVATNHYRPGLFTRLLAGFMGDTGIKVKTSGPRLIYCPLYVAIAQATFTRPLLADSRMNVALVVDGWRGETSLALGFPEVSTIECDPDQVVPVRIPAEQAGELALQEAERFMIRRQRKVPRLKLLGMEMGYKPNWVIRCELNNSAHYRVVDAETGIIVYRYDVEMPELKQHVPALADL